MTNRDTTRIEQTAKSVLCVLRRFNRKKTGIEPYSGNNDMIHRDIDGDI